MQRRTKFTMVDRGSAGPHSGPKVANSTKEDQRSSGLQRNPEAENTQKTWENRPKRCFLQQNGRQMPRQSSVDFYNSEQNRDTNFNSRSNSKCKKIKNVLILNDLCKRFSSKTQLIIHCQTLKNVTTVKWVMNSQKNE